MLEHLVADVRYASRWLRRNPAFALTGVLSLAVGIGFNAVMFSLVDGALFRPLPVDRPEQLADVFTSGSDGHAYATTSYPDFLDFKNGNQVFSDMLAFSLSLDAVTLADRPRLAMGEVVTGNYFQMLGVRAEIGRTLLPDDDRAGAARVAVLSYRAWQREYGGSPSVLGATLRIHGAPYTIVGVAPRTFTGLLPLVQPEIWTPTAYSDDVEPAGIISIVPSPTGATRLERRGERWLFVKGRLEPGETVDRASANLQTIAQQLAAAYPKTNKDRRASATPTSTTHIVPDADRAMRPIAVGLMAVVGLGLLVACANVASLLLARASGRHREIAVRLALGASRGRLVRQLLTESVVVSSLGALGGVALAWIAARLVSSIRPPIPIPITITLAIDGRVLAFTAVVAVLAGVLAGLTPALHATRPELVGELKGDATAVRIGGRRVSLSDALVAAQIAFALVLLVGGGLLARSVVAASRTSLGFEPARLAVVSAQMNLIGYDDTRATRFFERATARIRAIPGVESVTLAERTPFAIGFDTNLVFLPDRQHVGDKGLAIYATRVGAEYFATLGVSLLEGRNFSSADTPASPRVAIVNQAMARQLWPRDTAVGKRFRLRTLDGPLVEVVGVVADYKVNTIGEGATPYIHYAYTQAPDSGEAILARTRGDAGALLAAMRQALRALEPDVVLLDNQTMETQVGTTLLPMRIGAIGVSCIGMLAMLLAAVGLYGAVAYSVGRRTREIGLRMALGATRGAVMRLVMRQGLRVAAGGLLVGALLALAAARAASAALYGVSVFDPVAWGIASAAVLLVALAANLVPAARAASVAPTVALRSE